MQDDKNKKKGIEKRWKGISVKVRAKGTDKQTRAFIRVVINTKEGATRRK